MDPRSQGLLLAAVITLSLAVDTALRSRRSRRQILFMVFCFNLGIWQFTTFLARLFPDTIWQQVSLLAAVALPQAGLRFFHVFRGEELRRDSKMWRVSAVLGVISAALVVLPWYDHLLVKAFILAQAAGLMYAATYHLHRRTRKVESRVESTRVGSLVIGGAVAITFSVLDFLPAVGVTFPQIGTYLVLVFMYVLSQSLQRQRLLDIYELVGRLAVMTAMGTTLAAMFTGLVYWSELSGQFFLNAVVAALVILILFDPLRSTVEEKIQEFILRERWELERQIAATRADLWHVFDINEIGRVLMMGLDRTRRMTHAALFVVSSDGQRYERINSLGNEIPQKVELAAVRPLLDRLEREGVVTTEALTSELQEHREEGQEQLESAVEVLMKAMSVLRSDLILPISADEVALGLITLRDERLTEEPYTVDDIQTLKPLALQVGVAIQNSQYYAKMKERDRLASLGEMAAGLAHEIRNPLGAIKGAAELLDDPRESSGEAADEAGEFLDVIVEETDRLNRVVSTFLDYARPYKGNPELLNVNDVIRRTAQLQEASRAQEVDFELELDDNLPMVRADPERLHQVFINLIRNAVQAMDGRGRIRITSVLRATRGAKRDRSKVEIRFSDNGPGISEAVLEKIFIPFYTTKDEGTGLGLPICQRIVQDMGGSIEVDSTSTEPGTTFIVALPAAEDSEVESAITATGPFALRM